MSKPNGNTKIKILLVSGKHGFGFLDVGEVQLPQVNV